jgi:hypothetical protein
MLTIAKNVSGMRDSTDHRNWTSRFTFPATKCRASSARSLRRRARFCKLAICRDGERDRLADCSSALLNAGYKVSRSHALAGSIKTDAPRSFVHDIMREFIKTNPVRMDKVPEGNPARVLLAKEQT